MIRSSINEAQDDCWGAVAGGSGIIVLRTSVSSATFTSGVTCNGTSGGGTINGVVDGSDYVYSITAAGATDTVTF